MQINQHKITGQILWYLAGTALPMITLIIRSPIYTRIYTPVEYGQYTLVYISYTYLSSLFFQWISSGGWRYYLKYEKYNQKQLYQRIISYLYIISSAFLLVISLLWIILAINNEQKLLIGLGFLFATSQELLNTLLIPMRMKDKARLYNLVSSIRALVSFGLLLVLTFEFNYGIEAFFIAPIAVNLVFLAYFIFTDRPVIFRVNTKLFKLHLYRFIRYGISTFIYNTGLFLLVSGDRYIILLFDGYEKVGIYNQTYNIAQLSITAIFSAINAALNPLLLNSLDKKPNQSDSTILYALYLAIYLALPLTVILSFFSQEISNLLLGPAFREAWYLLPIIFFASFFSGITHYASVKLKFKNQYKILIYSALIGSGSNIILNIILVYFFGYKMAAITTLSSYLLLVVYLFKKSNLNPFVIPGFRSNIYQLLIPLITITLIHFVLNTTILIRLKNSIPFSILEAFLYILIFLIFTKKISPFKNDLFRDNV